MISKKLGNALLFWLILCDFFSKYNKIRGFNQSEIKDFQNKMYGKFQKYGSRKNV